MSSQNEYYTSEAQLFDELGLDIEDPNVVAKLEQDRDNCNCDLDDPCFNLACREATRRDAMYYLSMAVRGRSTP